MLRPGDVPPNAQMGYFFTKNPGLDSLGPILVKKSLEEGPISQKLRKNVKSAVLEIEKNPLRNVSQFAKISKKQNKTKQK